MSDAFLRKRRIFGKRGAASPGSFPLTGPNPDRTRARLGRRLFQRPGRFPPTRRGRSKCSVCDTTPRPKTVGFTQKKTTSQMGLRFVEAPYPFQVLKANHHFGTRPTAKWVAQRHSMPKHFPASDSVRQVSATVVMSTSESTCCSSRRGCFPKYSIRLIITHLGDLQPR